MAKWKVYRKKEKLDQKSFVVITRKYCLDYGKHRFELADKRKKQPNRRF